MSDCNSTAAIEEMAEVIVNLRKSLNAYMRAEGWLMDEWCILVQFIIRSGLSAELEALVESQDWSRERKDVLLDFISSTIASGGAL